MTINKLSTVALTSMMIIGALADGVAAASNLDSLPTSAERCSAQVLELLPPIASFNIIFEPACVEHGSCYATIEGNTREDCDRTFYSQLKQICTRTAPRRRWRQSGPSEQFWLPASSGPRATTPRSGRSGTASTAI